MSKMSAAIFLVAMIDVASMMMGFASADENPALGAAPKFPGVELVARAQTNYAVNCQGCHRADGEGSPERVPAMQGQVSQFLWVPGGREYLVRVPGMTNAAVSDAELAELANWVIHRFDPEHIPADFQPYTTSEIAENRPQAYTSEADAIREELLEKIAASAQAQETNEHKQ